MIWKRRKKADSRGFTAELAQLIVEARVEGADRQAKAITRWNLGSAEQWSADLALGTLEFTFEDHVLRGPVSLLGSYSLEGGTWMWGWGNSSVPQTVTEASSAVRALARDSGLEMLGERVLEVPPEVATDFADIAVSAAGLSGWYRGPSPRTHVYLGFTGFDSVAR